MQNLISRYKAFFALLPVIALCAIVTGVVPLADGVNITPVAYSLLGMTVAFLMSDTADSSLFIKAVVKYLASLDLADDTIEAELDSLSDIIGANEPNNMGTIVNVNTAPVGVASPTPVEAVYTSTEQLPNSQTIDAERQTIVRADIAAQG